MPIRDEDTACGIHVTTLPLDGAQRCILAALPGAQLAGPPDERGLHCPVAVGKGLGAQLRAAGKRLNDCA